MNISELIIKGAKLLSQNLEDINPRFESELLLSFVLKKERIYLLIHNNEEVAQNDEEAFLSLVKRRALGEPFAYITGTKEFMSLEFNVRPGVLIPRPDTETLVNHVIESLKGTPSPHILDLCTGSGAIAVSLAKYIKDASVTAIDISDICVKTTRENAKKNGTEKVCVLKTDILSHPLGSTLKFDCVVSNPPYIKTDVLPSLMKDVKDYEPQLALDGGKDGLVFYKKITSDAKELLKPGGLLAFEIGHDQAEDVFNIMEAEGFENISFQYDLAGIRRVISGSINNRH